MLGKILYRTAIVLGVLVLAVVVGIWLLRQQFTIEGPALHGIAGIGGTDPDVTLLAERITLPAGFSIGLYAQDLGPARILRFTPTGDLLVSISRKGRVLLLEPDRDGDGSADAVRVLLQDLDRPHGLDLHDGWLYFAENAAVRRVRFDAQSGTVSGVPERVAELPGGGIHWTRTLRFGPDGKLYVISGSSCNVCIEDDSRRTQLLRMNADGSGIETFAAGLRNTVGFDWQPGSGALYGVDNGRDLLGDDFPPDELNHIVAGGHYGWPFVHGFNVPDPEYGDHEQAPDAGAIPPAYAFGAHVAALSIHFIDPARAPRGFGDAALVGQHGSWNRSVLSGYRVSSLHWQPDGRIVERDFATGFERDGDVIGRPVDVVQGPDGAFYISDDYAGSVYRVSFDAAAVQGPGPVFEPPRAEGPDAAAVPPASAAPRPATIDADPQLRAGAELFASHRCLSCHDPRAAGMNLAGVGARYSAEELAALLEFPPTPMPAPAVDADERAALAAYLRAAFP